ncbi:hypothetical protein Pve01_18120 [Planomonospora venezuelensis]|nr:hypothetical protein Pve01_18120 [Planomonospora venezuelensis]
MPRGLPGGRSFHDEGVLVFDGRESLVWDACPTAPSWRGPTVCDHETPGSPRVTAGRHGSHDDPRRLAEDLPARDGLAVPPMTPGARGRGITFSPAGTTA